VTATVVKGLELATLSGTAADKAPRLGERLDLIEHVNVRLVVTLGEAEMNVARLFSLGAGDVVALDRDVDAPVDLRLNGKVVARGTLVAVGDRFGVRVGEILAE
jgi:flagellar motor switch protein FliN/FliY